MKNKIINFIFNRIALYLQNYRILLFKTLSKNKFLGLPNIRQPTLFVGKGKIKFNKNVNIGYFPSPFFYSGTSYIEARTKNSKIIFGKNIHINNNITIISEKGIYIGDNVLIGTNVEIYDSDFHSTSKSRIGNKDYKIEEVEICNNVWIGSNVKIMKGVKIGENSVIANGAIVTSNIEKNVIAGGLPAKKIKNLDNET